MDRLLWYVFAGSRGGATRVRIAKAIWDDPKNAHQLAKQLGLDYKTVEYNLRVLAKHVYVVGGDAGYGRLWMPSKNLRAAAGEFDRLVGPPRPRDDLGKRRNSDAGE